MVPPRIPVPLIAVLLLITATLAGCGGDEAPTAGPSTSPTPIAALETTGMSLVRVEFCDLVPRASIRRALAGAAGSSASWTNGDPVPGGKSGDLGHEIGCSWKGSNGRTARAWVFARPVSAPFATSLVKAAGDQSGCRMVPGPAFGKPTMAQVCTPGGTSGTTRARYAGLFADTWLTCEVTGPRAERDRVRARAAAWCVSVATTLDAGRE